MKKSLFLVVGILGFALVWAAGHDILSGEPDVWMEYTIVIAGLALALAALVSRLRKLKLGRRG